MTNNMRRQQLRYSRDASFRALHYEPDTFYNTTGIGKMSLECSNCGALNLTRKQMDCAALKAKLN